MGRGIAIFELSSVNYLVRIAIFGEFHHDIENLGNSYYEMSITMSTQQAAGFGVRVIEFDMAIARSCSLKANEVDNMYFSR